MDKNKKTEGGKEPSKAIKEKKENSLKKMRTMQSLMDAVGRIIEQRGYPGLTIMNIEAEAKQHRRLIYLYFGNVENLIETYIRQKDFWLFATQDLIKQLEKEALHIEKDDIVKLLQGQLNTMLHDKILQGIIHWELGKGNEVLRTVMERRTIISEQLFSAVEPNFKDKGVDLRGILALLIGGVYYISMQSTTTGGFFCGIDVNQPNGQKQIADALQTVVDWIYEKAEVTE